MIGRTIETNIYFLHHFLFIQFLFYAPFDFDLVILLKK